MSPWHGPFYAYISFVLSFYKFWGGRIYCAVHQRRSWKLVKSTETGHDVFIFLHSLQDPSTSVLGVLVFLKMVARDTNKKPVAAVRPDGDKSVDGFLRVRQGEAEVEFGSVLKVEKRMTCTMFDLIVECQVTVQAHTKMSN